MAYVRIVSDDEATEEQKVVIKHSNELFGRTANAVRAATNSPRLGQSIFGFIVAALREEITDILPVRTKCLVILKTSTLNGCAY